MDKYLISPNNLFRYKIISYNNLGNAKIMFLDTEEDECQNENVNTNISLPYGSNGSNSSLLSSNFGNNNIKTYSIKVYDKTLNPNNIKTIKINEINKLYEDIINLYYENAFNKKEGTEFDDKYIVNDIIDEQSLKNMAYKIAGLSNLMSSNSRYGSANTCILPLDTYKKLQYPKNLMGIKNWVINSTNIHNDKIILLRLGENLSEIGISVYMDYDLYDDRILKLEHILKKMGKNVKDRIINYNIESIGNMCKYTTGIIYINK